MPNAAKSHYRLVSYIIYIDIYLYDVYSEYLVRCDLKVRENLSPRPTDRVRKTSPIVSC